MPNKRAPKKGSRIKVGKLQQEERELTKDKQKKVKGGVRGGEIHLPGWGKPSTGGGRTNG